MTTTDFGTVSTDATGTQLHATSLMLWDWSHRPGSYWPCSVLARLDEIRCDFDARGDLVDLDDGAYDVPGDEFNAWSSDVLRAAGLAEHPAIRS